MKEDIFLMPIFLLLVAVPIIEIALFIEVGGWLGLWPTIGIVVLTAAIGTVLLRAQGLATIGELQRRLHAGENPAPTLAHGAMILVAGVLLLTPGFFTDGVGFALLMPPVREAAIRFARARMTIVHASAHMHGRRTQGWAGPNPGRRAGPGAGSGAGPGTVEGEYEVVQPEEEAPPGDTSRGDRGWTRIPGGLGAQRRH